MTIGPLIDELNAALRAYETSRGRLMDVPRMMSRFS